MRTLPLPSRDLAREQLIKALRVYTKSGKQHGYPANNDDLDKIIALYNAYDEVGGAPSDHLKGLSLKEALRITIQKSYEMTQVRRRLASIRSNLMQGVEHCPICGISPPRVLDHHLPKADYHPLAIYVRNLIPLCGECNHLKGAVSSANPAEQFIHPYFDALPNIRFLRAIARIHGGGLIVDFGLDPAANLPNILAARLNHQLLRLRLNTRYAQEINSYLISQATSLLLCFNAKGSSGVRHYLKQQASVEFEKFHINHWRPLLLLALADHADFCNGAFRAVLSLTPIAEHYTFLTTEPHD